MRVLTSDLLVAAVSELSKGSRLVRAKDVVAWCEYNGVDAQGEGFKNQALWEADHDEARGRHRLLKFRSGESKQSRMGWALVTHGERAREAAAHLGWGEQCWTGESWDWLSGSPPVPTRRYGAAAHGEQGGCSTTEGTSPG
ncbi:hypothetical protein [Corallococcus sp. CA047B]|uniref:hypothetical protein n=1 Tax=Corallococcus sp. CA047B TaxID=2316729 RepID=UPI0018F6A199|nr:hypothetical protein [Corallococcus sp. CA047B]